MIGELLMSNKYIIRRGDTLYRISKENNMSVDDIIKINNITNPNEIQVGQEITLKNPPENLGEMPIIVKEYMPFIKEREGFRSFVYLDTGKLPTIGYGTLLSPSNRIKMKELFGEDRTKRLVAGEEGLSEAEASLLAENDLKEYVKTCKRMTPGVGFDNLPLSLRRHLVFQTRRGCWTKHPKKGSPNAIAAFMNRDFGKFEYEMTDGRGEYRDAIKNKARGIMRHIDEFVSDAWDSGYFDPMNKYGFRRNQKTFKERGFLGEITRDDGKIMTEMSVGVEFDGKEVDIPTLYTGMPKDQLDFLIKGGDPRDNEALMEGAEKRAKARMKMGKSPFYNIREDAPTYEGQEDFNTTPILGK